jgi:Baseplate J-like protein
MTTSNTTPVSAIPVSVDYLSRDFTSLRNDLIGIIQTRIPSWTATDPSDFGIALVEAFAYVGDMISYYIDRNANEASISTAVQRNSILNIAQTYGYTPAGYRQSYVNLTFSNSSSSDITVPSGTVVTGQVVVNNTVQNVNFTTPPNSDLVVPANSSATTTAFAGELISILNTSADPTYGELIGTSDGTPSQAYSLSQTSVVDGNTTVYIQDGDVYSQWTQVTHLTDYGPYDLVYTLTSDENNVVYVNFGDGVSGAIPVIYSEIRAMYTVGGGSVSNVAPDVINTITYVPGLSDSQLTALQSTLTVYNAEAAIGGDDPESNDSIRISAPAALSSGNRAVTLNDFTSLAVTVNNCGKANAVSENWSSVTLYLAPVRSAGTTDPQPGLNPDGTESVEYTTLEANVQQYLSDKVLIGTQVTTQPPVYIDLAINLEYVLYPSASSSTAEANIMKTILTAYQYTNMDFADTIYPSDIAQLVTANVPEVRFVNMVSFSRVGITAESVAASTPTTGHVTYTTSAYHGLQVGGLVTISGFGTSGYNVTNAPITAVTADTFTIANSTTGSTTGTGEVVGYSTQTAQPFEIFRIQEANVAISNG